MSDALWDGLTRVEQDLMICAHEAWGILPYACGSTHGHGEPPSDSDIAAALLGLVDRGWVEVRRLERRPDDEPGLHHGPPIPRQSLERILRLPETWDDPADPSWAGALTLTRTDRWEAAAGEQRAAQA